MCLNAIIAHYHAVLLCPRVRTALIWNFDLHVNVVNFHIIKIHKSNTIGRPGIRARACVRVCVWGACKLLQEWIHVCLYMHMQLHFYICVCLHARICYMQMCSRACVCLCVRAWMHVYVCVWGQRRIWGWNNALRFDVQLLEYIRDFRKVTVGERVTRYESIKRNIGTSHTHVRVCMCQRGRVCAHSRRCSIGTRRSRSENRHKLTITETKICHLGHKFWDRILFLLVCPWGFWSFSLASKEGKKKSNQVLNVTVLSNA